MRRKTIKIKRDVIEHGNRRTQRQKGNQHGEKTDIIHEAQNTEKKLGQTGRERKLLSSEDHRKQNWKALGNNIILTSTKQSLNTDHIMSTQKLKTLGQRCRTMTTSSQIMMLVSLSCVPTCFLSPRYLVSIFCLPLSFVTSSFMVLCLPAPCFRVFSFPFLPCFCVGLLYSVKTAALKLFFH